MSAKGPLAQLVLLTLALGAALAAIGTASGRVVPSLAAVATAGILIALIRVIARA